MDRLPEPNLPIGTVTCGLCGHAVERIEWWQDPATDELVMVAYCHGQRDERRISDKPMSLDDARRFAESVRQGGVAFDQTKLIGVSNGP